MLRFGKTMSKDKVSNVSSAEANKKEVLKVVVTKVLGGGKFYVQIVGNQKVTAIQQQFAALNVNEAPVIGSFNPSKGDIGLARFSMDNSWNRAMEGLARLERKKRWDTKAALDNLEEFQEEAKKERLNIWQHGMVTWNPIMTMLLLREKLQAADEKPCRS